MNSLTSPHPLIIRTERGLTISGTRITLYDIMDSFELTDSQLSAVISYIEQYREKFEAEYQEILANAAEIKEYWEAYNSERLAKLSSFPPSNGYEKARARLVEGRQKRETEQK